MRPLIITPLFPPAVGGSATYFGQLAGRLASEPQVTRLTLLTERATGYPQREEQGKLTILRLLPPRLSIPTRPYVWHAASYIQTQLWFARHLPKLVQHEKIELIHFHTRYRGEMFYRALRRSHAPTIADLRDKLTDPAQLARVSQRLMCCCEGVRGFALAGGYPASQLRLVPMAFSPPRRPDEREIQHIHQRFGIESRPYLLFLGDITENKGVLKLLPAFKQWCVQHPQVALLLAGMNRLGGSFVDLVAETPNTRYLGSVPHDTALALIAGAKIVLLPSRSEGLPRVILESLALERRVLAPPDIPEFNRHIPEYVLSEITIPAIVAKLEQIWRSPAPQLFPIENHQYARVIATILEVYQELRD